jgi:hypothetical protein
MHRLWHVLVLGSTLLAGAGLAIVFVSPLFGDDVSTGVRRARPLVFALAALALTVLLVEWLIVH